ncbi:MAG TPA: aminotransferase class I/II-fold pyridoxal phosphate-dependent enzyme [Actinocrinis sp.]|nr:aminotransferase class I/II-fold pyridoxal phosphate-dependent enzyme [Actinocrinis sp.]
MTSVSGTTSVDADRTVAARAAVTEPPRVAPSATTAALSPTTEAEPALGPTLRDISRLAEERLAPQVWDYIDGGAGQERTLAANLAAFDAVRLVPRILTGSGQADTSVSILGRTWAAPLGIAPMAYHTLVHPEGELASVRAATVAGLPTVLSMFAGRSLAQLAPEAGSPLWMQIYCLRDRTRVRDLITRAENAGVEALVLTVDAPVLGPRLRDVRNGFRLPPGVRPANLPGMDASDPAAHALAEFDPWLEWSVIGWLRSISTLPIVLKGVLNPRDARRAVDEGADALVVSNHGGRQLDGAPAALDALPAVAAAVAGACPVLLDGGVRRGSDILAALALGADAVLAGRPLLHGLAVAGYDGALAVLEILKRELRDAMTLAGFATVADVEPDLVIRTPTAPPPPPPQPRPRPANPHRATDLSKSQLHASLCDPDLDSMAFLNEVTDRFPDALSFAPGRPYEGDFDIERVFDDIRGYLGHLEARGLSSAQIRSTLYQYGPAAGQIRDLIADSLARDEAIDATADSIVVTVGAQEGMLLTLRALFAEPEDLLLVSIPCYVGIIGAAKLLGIDFASVQERDDGLAAADVESAILAQRSRRRRPRALYLVPDHSNPSGNTLPLQERHALLDLAARHDILLIEDSPYRLVSAGQRLPTLKRLDRDRRVVHIGSYAKSAFPGARLGYVVADQVVTDPGGHTSLLAAELAKIKSMVTVNTPTLSQAAVAGLLLTCEGRLSDANAGAAAHYRENLDTLLAELDRHFPPDTRAATNIGWNKPAGGFFLRMRVPFRADEAALTRSARDFGVLWTPMSYFHPEGGGEREIRLAFSALTPPLIREAVARLAHFIEAEAEAECGGSRPALEQEMT